MHQPIIIEDVDEQEQHQPQPQILDYEKEGEWIPTKLREEFIKMYRLKINLQIKFTKGYDLYKHRLEEWRNATQRMKDDYEEMKKDAQVEEFKFMESVMEQYGFKQVDERCRKMFIELNHNKHTKDGKSVHEVREYMKLKKQELIKLYMEKQKAKFKQMDV